MAATCSPTRPIGRPRLTVFGGAVAVLAVLARWGSPVRRAALYATAASITWALMAAFIKATTDVLAASGLVATLSTGPSTR